VLPGVKELTIIAVNEIIPAWKSNFLDGETGTRAKDLVLKSAKNLIVFASSGTFAILELIESIVLLTLCK